MSIQKTIRIGVLDIQGSVEEHIAALKKLGITAIAVKTKKDLEKVNGLIIPGGESTTIGKLMKKYGLDKEIYKRAREKRLSLWGTCAGAILLAKKIYNRSPYSLKLMDINIARNAYGRQIDSFETKISIPGFGKKKIPAIFIRAPQVKKVETEVNVLAKHAGSPIMVQQGNLLATMFHPELSSDLRIHDYFLKLTKKYALN